MNYLPTEEERKLDQMIRQVTEAGLPIVRRPFAEIAERIGVSPERVQERLTYMLATGAVRRIAAVPNHYRLGYVANAMTVWNVPDEYADQVGHQLAAETRISHCYLRSRHPGIWEYNMFAMVHGRDRDEVEAYVHKHLAARLAPYVLDYTILWSKRILKKTGFRSSQIKPAADFSTQGE